MIDDRKFLDHFVIAHDNPIKSKLDAWVMILVAYSCITSLYNSSFTPLSQTFKAVAIWDLIVEVFFYIDLIGSFFHSYYDELNNIVVDDFDTIYK